MKPMRISTRDDGATAVEYALLIGAIAAVVVIAIFAIGAITRGQVSSVCDQWSTAANDATICK
jgi:Flp pilus assembly pilin Flp